MEKIAHSFGLRRSTRSFAKLSSNASPQPQHSQPPSQSSSRRANKENFCRQSMGPPLAPAPGKSHLPLERECDPGSKRAMLSVSTCATEKSNSSTSSNNSSSKKVNASWDRRLSVGIKRTISKLKLNSKSSSKSNYLPVMDYQENDAPSPTASSVSSVSTGRSKSGFDSSMPMYRNGIGASLDQLNSLGSTSSSGSGRYYENQATNFNPVESAEPQRSRSVSTRQQISSSGNSGVIGGPTASPYIARAPRMGTSALRYSRDPTASSSRPSRLDQSFNAMLPVAEENSEISGDVSSNGTDGNGSFLWKAGWLSRYNLRSSRSRLNMSYADDQIVAGGGVDDSYMVEDLDDTRGGDVFNASLAYSVSNQ